MHWKCRIGLHDWERITNRKREARDGDGCYPWLFDYLCVRVGCHKTRLEATNARIASAKAEFNRDERKNIANEKAMLNIKD